jgi:uncharacterized protein
MHVSVALVLALLPLAGVAAQSSAPPLAAPTAYYVVFLRPAPSRRQLPPAEGDRLQAAHMANIHQMAHDGVLVAAGPFDDPHPTISGVFVMAAPSLDAARAIAARDPTVLAHRNTIDVHAWRGPPGIGAEYVRLHARDPSIPENMQMHPFCMLARGTEWDRAPRVRDSLLDGHERYIAHLRSRGVLGAAGPVEEPDDIVALVIFKPLGDADARALMADDVAVRAQVLRLECHQWWSSDHVLPW